jgi:hypothetical protein
VSWGVNGVRDSTFGCRVLQPIVIGLLLMRAVVRYRQWKGPEVLDCRGVVVCCVPFSCITQRGVVKGCQLPRAFDVMYCSRSQECGGLLPFQGSGEVSAVEKSTGTRLFAGKPVVVVVVVVVDRPQIGKARQHQARVEKPGLD